ncbi:DUF1540 domain-containing protein [Rhodococcus sp. BP-349]|jgi:hypothetical protein|uniref:DUF1540 domain-containing protein n=1 Tax=Rhodococcoides corynebacterioides TaxID=53972 RepID=A0ABS2KWM8_9NOCA|nr:MULTISPECIES: DUF1540 domain-containing protein [Rhodococcus]MBM7415681.1 hypothetical protein [Rhodococcus corynebacterioides]MBP1118143.1 hypothetical protein [Rhodococcus sp. PvP016]MBY6540180.1 DUF1540 domain-containing protein [Rhodococcus sp. BP-363]MBY6543492.1 DUF1540 domain-containing protein [Rhodococcus sp. BP-369]MBY6562722.1 DUF1540 domain-containing protein [Rhodococcus sp. BP-370]
MTSLEMPRVSECSVSACSYNHDGCHAFAINVGGSNGTADCGTFIPLSTKGGLDTVSTQVGACQRVDCSFNDNLECSAAAVRIGAGESSDTANCLTYSKA